MPRKGYKTITITEELYDAHLHKYEKNIGYWRRRDLDRYTTCKVPAGWNKIIEAYREKHQEALTLRGVTSNSGAVLYILTKVMEKEGLI